MAGGRSLIYRSGLLYELLIVALYRRHYGDRYSAVAELIPAGSSVLEVCCGPGALYQRYLKGKQVRYMGLDLSPSFVDRLRRQNVDARLWDLRRDTPLPRADFVVMQGSLYQFLPDPRPIVDRMLEAAQQAVVVAEPIHNLTVRSGPLRRAFAALADAGTGAQAHRFDERTLDELLAGYRSAVVQSFLPPPGREKVYVLGSDGN